MSIYHAEIITKDYVKIVDESNGKIFDDFQRPLTSEKKEVLHCVISDVENDICEFTGRGGSGWIESHYLNQRDILLNLLQNNSE